MCVEALALEDQPFADEEVGAKAAGQLHLRLRMNARLPKSLPCNCLSDRLTEGR